MSSAPYASPPTTMRHDKDPGSGALVAVVAIMLGILVAVLGIFALLMWLDARNHNDANSSSSMADMPGMTATTTGTGAMTSYAGASPANADATRRGPQGVPGDAPRRGTRCGRRRPPRAEGHHRRDRPRASSTRPGHGRAALPGPSFTCARDS